MNIVCGNIFYIDKTKDLLFFYLKLLLLKIIQKKITFIICTQHTISK